jgi:hypothetical protein
MFASSVCAELQHRVSRTASSTGLGPVQRASSGTRSFLNTSPAIHTESPRAVIGIETWGEYSYQSSSAARAGVGSAKRTAVSRIRGANRCMSSPFRRVAYFGNFTAVP